MSSYKYVASIGRVFVDEAVRTPPCRLSFPHLVTPKPGGEREGQVYEDKYEAQGLIDKNDPDLARFNKMMGAHKDQMILEFNKNSGTKIADVDLFKDGDRANLEKYPNNKNCWLITGRNKNAVKCFDEGKNPIDPSALEAGMLVRFLLRPHLGGGGLGYYLEGVQRLKDDGVRFGGSVREYTDMFDAIEGEGEVDVSGGFDAVEEAPVALMTPPVPQPVTPPPTQVKNSTNLADERRAKVAEQMRSAKGKAAAKNLLGGNAA